MSILSFKKLKTSLVIAGLFLANPLYAQINFQGTIGANIANQINQYLAGQTSLISNYLSNLLGVKVNINCLLPPLKINQNFGIGTYAFCNFEPIYNFKFGPCQAEVDFSTNSLYKQTQELCNLLNQGISIKGSINIGFTDVSVQMGLKDNAPLSHIKYPSGLSFQDIYGNNEGSESFFINAVKHYPNSSDAKAFLTNDKETLILKDIALKQSGTSNLSSLKLPKNLARYIKAVNDNARVYADSIPDIVDIIGNSQSVLLNKCLPLSKNNDGTFNYEKYFNCYQKYIKGNTDIDPEKTIPKLYKTIDSAIDYKYANKLMILKATSNFFEYAPTQNKLDLLPVNEKKDFLYRSVIWSAQETDLLGQREEERKKAHIKVRIATRKAYIASMPFDEVKAQKELDALLQ